MKCQCFKITLPAVAALFFASGCVHNVQYEPVKRYDYSQASLTAPENNTEQEQESVDAVTSAHYTSSVRVSKERMRDPNVLGNLHLKSSSDPNVESTVFTIRKEHRAYRAETPILASFKAGEKTVTPHFAVGVHKDHDAVAGFVFRMPF